MQNKKIKIIASGILIFLLTMTTFSCKKLFETQSKDFLEENKAYQDNFEARSAVLGVYALLQNVAEQQVILGELQADLLTVTENADEDLIQVNEHTMDANNKYADPTNYYRLIVNCNEVMQKISRVRKTDKSVTPAILNGYLAELTIVRAWSYFALIKIYGEVPYFEEPLDIYSSSDTVNSKLNRLQSEDFILDTLLTQLTAIDTFNLNINEASPFFAIRAKRSTIWTLQSEIYLWRNDYSNAKKASYKVINYIGALGWNGAFRLPWINSLSYNYTDWKNLFSFNLSSGDFESNAIFIVPFSKTYGQTNNLQKIFSYGTGGSYLLKPTDFAISNFQAQKIVSWEKQPNDIPGTAGDLNRGKGISYDSVAGKPVVMKYSIFKEPFSNDAGLFIYRTSDYHLYCCEAICRLGQTSNAIEHLNQGKLYNSAWGMGTRSSVNITNVSAKNPKDINEVENLIFNERALELAFEGHRWFDLIRFARHKNDPAFLADKVSEKFTDPVKKAEVRARMMNQNNWFLPFHLKK